MVQGRSGVAGFEKARWKLLAFLGRYGHQPFDVCVRLPGSDLRRMADAVACIMEEEATAVKGASDG